jgi:chromosome segregation ATPase
MEKMEEQINLWHARVTEFTAEASSQNVDVTERFQQQMEDLKDKTLQARTKVRELKHAPEAVWQETKQDVEMAFSEVAQSMEEVASFLKQ